MKIFTTRVSKKVGILMFWLLIWEGLSLLINNQILLPQPLSVLITLSKLIFEKYFWKSVLLSIIRVILGVLTSIILGIILGIFSGLNIFLEEILEPFIIAVKATPVMSIIIIALVWFNSNSVPIFTTILMCFPMIYTNVLQGIKSVDKNLISMAKLYKVRKIYILKQIYFPWIMPYIYSGILMCLGVGWKVSVASEVLSTPKFSIGLNILSSKSNLDTEELFAWTIIVVLLSLILENVFKKYVNKRTRINIR
ncbi:ABC transporter permease [Clostridiaceae bacterium 14S0207]|nr:ABC transporter permease [Clostridiaceae bacterium 14S0207]